MAATTESSVMMALSELQRIEAERIAEETAREAERRRLEEERRRREREEREEAERHRLRVAEAEARLRVAEELQTAEARSRAARLADELQSMKAERQAMADELSALAGKREPPRPSGGRVWLAAVLVGLGGLTAALAAPARRPAAHGPQGSLDRPTAAPTTPRPPVETSDSARRIAELEERLNKIMRAAPRDSAPLPRPTPHARPRPRPDAPGAADMLRSMDDCSKDPLCGTHLRN